MPRYIIERDLPGAGTLTPAELFGVANEVGSLQAGRAANVVVWSGDPFEFGSRAEHVLVRGALAASNPRVEILTAENLA